VVVFERVDDPRRCFCLFVFAILFVSFFSVCLVVSSIQGYRESEIVDADTHDRVNKNNVLTFFKKKKDF
jgi:hypothetical protein